MFSYRGVHPKFMCTLCFHIEEFTQNSADGHIKAGLGAYFTTLDGATESFDDEMHKQSKKLLESLAKMQEAKTKFNAGNVIDFDFIQ